MRSGISDGDVCAVDAGSRQGSLQKQVPSTLFRRYPDQWALALPASHLHEEADQAVVKVLATQVRVSGGRLDLEDALLDGQQRHIKGAAAQVEDEHALLVVASTFRRG